MPSTKLPSSGISTSVDDGAGGKAGAPGLPQALIQRHPLATGVDISPINGQGPYAFFRSSLFAGSFDDEEKPQSTSALRSAPKFTLLTPTCTRRRVSCFEDASHDLKVDGRISSSFTNAFDIFDSAPSGVSYPLESYFRVVSAKTPAHISP